MTLTRLALYFAGRRHCPGDVVSRDVSHRDTPGVRHAVDAVAVARFKRRTRCP